MIPPVESVETIAGKQPWYRKPLCWTGTCDTFRTESDDTGCWGQFSICGLRSGFVDRATLRRVADAMAEIHDAHPLQRNSNNVAVGL